MDPQAPWSTVIAGGPSLPTSSDTPSAAVADLWTLAVNVEEIIVAFLQLPELGVCDEPVDDL